MKAVFILIAAIFIAGCSPSTADKWYDSDKELYIKYANSMDSIITKDINVEDMTLMEFSGYSGELLFIHYLMSSLGYGQIIMQYPELKDRYINSMEYCIDMLLTPEIREFDTSAWDEDPMDGLLSDNAHGAYFNYLNVALSMHRVIEHDSKYNGLNDSVSLHIIKQLQKSEYSLIATYPNSYYPADISAALGSLGLYRKATGKVWRDETVKAARNFAYFFSNDKSLVYHYVQPHYSKGEARGASTAFSAYFLYYSNTGVSRMFFEGLRDNLFDTKFVAISGIREYEFDNDGPMDGDSGPIVLGLGVSATGFTLATAKVFRDKKVFKALYSTASTVGGGSEGKDTFIFKRGEFIGNSILFAMLTL